MDKTIDMYVNGSYLRKNSNSAGVQGEGNAATLHIIFDESWSGLAKAVTFWDSRGENPTKVILTNTMLVDITNSLLEYNCPIPPEPMTYEGRLTFIIDGYADGKRQRSTQDTLNVDAALTTDNASEPSDPTPTQAEQLQSAIEAILPNVQAETVKAQTAATAAASSADDAETYALKAAASVTAAKNSETAAAQSASAASVSASSAAGSAAAAQTAQTAAESAKSVVHADKTAAETAKNEAVTAKTFAETAQSKAEAAQEAAETAQNKAETAQSKAEMAQTAAETAKAGAENAKTAADRSATTAAESVSTASAKATEATNQAVLSKSYAVGGTGTRTGEDSDNAKYYCEHAAEIVGGNYVTDTQLNVFKTTNIDPIAEDVTELQVEIAEMAENISANETAITALQAKDTQFETDIAAFNEALANVPSVAQQNTWSAKVGSVNGKTGTSVTLGASDVGAVPTTRKVNNHALSEDITLTPEDIGAADDTKTVHTTGDESIAGCKTFSTKVVVTGQISVPLTPTANAHAASKQYVDDSISTAITTALNTGV